MKNKLKNINEEILRIKSLFTEERLYGNYEENLLLEQGIGRRLADALSAADSSVVKAVKNIDPKIATNFLETEIDTFDDLIKHFNTYKSVWKSMGMNWDTINDGLLFLNKSSKSGLIKQIPEDEMLQFINDLPTDGDLRGMVFDLWKESKGVPPPKRKPSPPVVITKSKNGENVLHTIEGKNADGSDNIKTYELRDNGDIVEDLNYNKTDAQKDIDDFFGETDGTSGSVNIKSDEFDANGNPDNIKGEIISAIEEGFNKIIGKGGKQIDADQVIKEIDNGKVLMIRQPDGSIKVINTVELIEVTIDEFGNVTNVKSIGTKDTTPTGSPVKDGGKSTDITDGGKSTDITDGGDGTYSKSSKFNIKISEVVGQGFRWTFPTASQILKYVSILGPGRKFYSKPRFSFVDRIPGAGDTAQYLKSGSKVGIELPTRLIAEQVALITLVGMYKSFERGELPKDESVIATATADYWNTKIWRYHPINWVPNALVWAYEDAGNIRNDAYASCRSKCEQKMKPEEVTNSSCFKDCKSEVDKFFDKMDELKKSLKEFRETYVELMNINEWDQERIERFCNTELAEKQEKLRKMRESLTNLDKDIEERFKDSKLKEKQWIPSIVNALNNYIPGLPELPTYEEMIDKVIPKSEVDGKPLRAADIQELENKLNQACAEYNNKKREIEDDLLVDPDNNPTNDIPLDTNRTKEEEDNLEELFGSVKVIVEPIEIV
jgi:hypothetical protein